MKIKLLVILFLLIAVPCFSATYYIRTDGHDTASGANNTTDGTTGAWLTVQHAADTMVAGDTVNIANGTYDANVTISTSGTVGNVITYIGASTAAYINGKISVTANYITLDTLKIANTDCPTDYSNWYQCPAIDILGTASNGTVQNCLFDPGATIDGPYGSNIYFEGTNNDSWTIQDNTFQNMNYIKGIVRFNDTSDSITVSGNTFVTTWDCDVFYMNGNNNTISGNNISANVLYRTDAQHSDVMQIMADYVTNIATNVIFEKNYVHDTDTNIFYSNRDPGLPTGVHDITFRNNIFANVTGEFRCSLPNIFIYNNVFYNCGTDYDYTIQIGGAQEQYDNTGLAIINNIFVSNNSRVWVENSNGYDAYTHTNNYYGNLSYASNGSYAHGGNTTPITEATGVFGGNVYFVNRAGGDYTITNTGSVVSNVGAPLAAVTEDYAAAVRSNPPEIGPYEIGGASDTTAPTLSNLLPSGTVAYAATKLLEVTSSADSSTECRYHATETVWASMTKMTTTDLSGGTHSQTVNTSASTAYTYNILCRDAAANESLAGTITFTTTGNTPAPTGCTLDAAGAGSIGLGSGGSFVLSN